MAALFTAASSQYLTNATPPFTGYPFTFGVWVWLSATGTTRGIINVNSSNGDQIYLESAGGLSTISHLNGGNRRSGGSCSGLIGATWNFLIWRCISSTNRRLSELTAAGASSHGQDTTSTPLTAPTFEVGRRNTSANFPGSEWDGLMGGFWYTNTDVQADGAQLTELLLRQLAFNGPFSVPHIANDILEYRSLLVDPTRDQIGEVYYGAGGIQTWTNTAGVSTGPCPPLPYSYVNPGQRKLVLSI